MTQQQSPTWLITAPEGESFNDLLVIACRGNQKLASLLYVFFYQGRIAAKGKDPSKMEYVRLRLELDDIVKGLDYLHRHASVPTIIKWIDKLEGWGFVKADGYRHQYDLYFHKVEDAIKDPPAEEKHPPRGRHAHRRNKDLSFEDSTSEQDLSFEGMDLTFDYTNEARNGQVETLILPDEMLKVKSEMLKFESRIKEFESEMLKVKSDLSHERACRAALEAKVERLYNLIDKISNINLNERREEIDATPAPSPPNAFSLSSSSHHENKAVRVEIRESLSLGGEQFPPTVWIYDKPHENAQTTSAMFSVEHSLALLNHLEQKRPMLEQITGDVTNPPPSVEGVPPLSSPQGDTLNLDTQPFLPAPDKGSAFTGQIADKSLTSPNNVLIVAPMGTTKPNEQQDASGARGYTNEPPDSDALPEQLHPVQQSVMPNDTAELGVITQEVVLAWVEALAKEETCFSLGRAEKRNDAVKALGSIISSMDDLRGLYEAASRLYGGGIVYLTNLVSRRVLDAWERSKPPVMSEGEMHNALLTRVGLQYPDLLAQSWPTDQGLYMVVWFGDGKEDYLLFRNLADWEEVASDPQGRELLDAASAYGRQMAQPLEAVAV